MKTGVHIKTLAANVAIEAAMKKKENPYLAHKTSSSSASVLTSGTASVVPGLGPVPGLPGFDVFL